MDEPIKMVAEGLVTLAKSGAEYWLAKRAKKVALADEVRSIVAALDVEICALSEAILARRNWWVSEVSKDQWLPPLLPFFTEAYDQVKSRLEKLPPELVAATVRFYGYLRFANALHDVRKEYQKTQAQRKRFQEIYLSALDQMSRVANRSLIVFARFRS